MMVSRDDFIPFRWMFPRGIDYTNSDEPSTLSDKERKKRKIRNRIAKESRRRNR